MLSRNNIQLFLLVETIKMILLVLLISCAAYSQETPLGSAEKSETPKNNTNKHKDCSTHIQFDPRSSSINVKVSTAPNTQIEPKTESKSYNNDWGLIIPTWFLALCTFGLVIYTARLWGATSKLVKGAEVTAERQLRAYISVSAAKINNLDNSDIPNVVISFINCGETPAKEVTYRGCFAVREFPLKTNLAFDSTDGFPKITLHMNIGPGVVHSLCIKGQNHEAITADEKTEIKAGTKALYVYGVIIYKDIFEIDRHTNFRFKKHQEVFWRDESLGVCEEGNDGN